LRGVASSVEFWAWKAQRLAQADAVYLTLKSAPGWLSNREIAKAASVPERTVQIVEAGIAEVSKVHGGYRFRMASLDKQKRAVCAALVRGPRSAWARRNR
jgi:hypothetical protein